MKTLSIKNIINTIFPIYLIILFSVSCSSDDDKDTEVVFTSLEASKTNAFIEETITLNFNGTGYTDVNVTSSNPLIKINKAANSVYEISSTERTYAKIYVELKNNTNSQIKNIDLLFVEHGVKDSNIAEGIRVNSDNSSKVLKLLGEPDIKSDSEDGLSEYWRYASRGLRITIIKKTTIVNEIDMYSSNYSFTNKENVNVNYTNYLYEIGNGWKINNSATTMDMVVNQLGSPSSKSTSSTSPTNRTYEYANQRMLFRFYSDSEDSYTGKKIISFSIY